MSIDIRIYFSVLIFLLTKVKYIYARRKCVDVLKRSIFTVNRGISITSINAISIKKKPLRQNFPTWKTTHVPKSLLNWNVCPMRKLKRSGGNGTRQTSKIFPSFPPDWPLFFLLFPLVPIPKLASVSLARGAS